MSSCLDRKSWRTDPDYVIYDYNVTNPITGASDTTRYNLDDFLNYTVHPEMAFDPKLVDSKDKQFAETLSQASTKELAKCRETAFMVAQIIYNEVNQCYYNEYAKRELFFTIWTAVLKFLSCISSAAKAAFIDRIYQLTKSYFKPEVGSKKYIHPFLTNKHVSQFEEEVINTPRNAPEDKNPYLFVPKKEPLQSLNFPENLDLPGPQIADLRFSQSTIEIP